MKNYRIVITSEAEAVLNSFVDYIAIEQGMPKTAERWFKKALIAVNSLKQLPDRCSVAPEDCNFDFTVACDWLTTAYFFTALMKRR